MVQTLAALLSWIAMLALISIGVLVSGIWRPTPRKQSAAAPSEGRVHQLRTAAQARAQTEAIATARRRTEAQRQRRAA